MTKKQFLTALDNALRTLPKEEREEMLRDFEEHFAIAQAEGKSEAEIASALGSAQQIAKEAIATNQFDQVETNATTGNFFRAMWAGIGVVFFNLVIVLGPFIAILGILLAGWIISVSFVASPLLVLVNYIIFPSSFELFDLFVAISLCGLGIFIGLGMYVATKGMSYRLVRYLKFNINLVKGGLQA